MNLFKYFKFYYNLTERKIIFVILLALVSSGFQSCALSALSAVSEYATKHGNECNAVARFVYSAIAYIGIKEGNQTFAFLLFLAAASMLAMSIFMVVTDTYVVMLQNKIYKRIQKNLMESLVAVEYEFFASQSIGYFNNVLLKQLMTVSSSFKFFSNIFVQIISIVPFLLIAFSINFKLALILCAVLTPLFLPMTWINRKTKKYSIENVSELTKLNSLMIQILTHYKYLKATNNYPSVFSRLYQIVHRVTRLGLLTAVMGSLSGNAVLSLAIMIICALVYWQVAVVGASIVSAGFVLGLLYMASTRLNAIPVTYQKFVASAGSILIYEKIVNDLQSRQEHENQTDSHSPVFTGDLVFNNVTFKYASANRNALEQVSLKIKPNSVVGFVGESGAGKSTIVNAIAGLLKPTSGEISLSGTDYSELDLRTLRNGMGYVTQEAVIFSDTAKNNISLWNSDDGKVISSAEAAHAHEFIVELPNGYDTMLGDNGVNISGGQRQRISIAREFYRETPVLILDEATSALDSETEKIIQQSVKELHGKKTLIIIAHRLSTIKECDVIYVLDKGRVVERGAYEELLAQHGLFKRMVDKQSL